MAPFKWQNSDGSGGNGLTKIIFEVILVGCVGALIAWGAATTTLDSVKVQVKETVQWKEAHSVSQAKFEGAISENLSAMKELLKEIRDDQKEIRKELNKKQDKK